MTEISHEHFILKKLDRGGEKTQWKDWHWHMSHLVTDIAVVEELLGISFPPETQAHLEETIARFPMSITPYYLSLIDRDDYANDPVFRQSFPSPEELIIESCDMPDPLAEEKDSPAPCITHRYPDRVLFIVSTSCAMYCRHCTRKRKVGDTSFNPTREELRAGLDYIAVHPEIRDVLLSGGDPLLLSDETLDWILSEVRNIPHVEIIRIGTRVPVVLPFRVTEGLVRVLRKHHPLWINTHYNHPREITRSSEQAIAMLADAGIPLGNQSVLLAGVNDCPRIMKFLVQKLVKNRIRPYYLFQCDLSEGLAHFRTPIGKGIEIIESLVGHTSGLAVPTYVIDAPGGGGKIPVMPNYLISWSTNKVVLRNYEGMFSTYREPDRYTAVFCDRNCRECSLQLPVQPADESRAEGIERLLSDYDKQITLIPGGTGRIERREIE